MDQFALSKADDVNAQQVCLFKPSLPTPRCLAYGLLAGCLHFRIELLCWDDSSVR